VLERDVGKVDVGKVENAVGPIFEEGADAIDVDDTLAVRALSPIGVHALLDRV
jgi:hypothetical protein